MKTSALLLVSALAAAALPANAQTYPARPIELISPTGAGGGSDLVARMVAEIIAKEKLLPQPVVVQNKPGGGGAIGQTYAAGKRGDPYTVLLATTTLISVPVRTGLDVGRDKFQPIAAIGFDLNSLAVNPDSPYQVGDNIKDVFVMPYAPENSYNLGADWTFAEFGSNAL